MLTSIEHATSILTKYFIPHRGQKLIGDPPSRDAIISAVRRDQYLCIRADACIYYVFDENGDLIYHVPKVRQFMIDNADTLALYKEVTLIIPELVLTKNKIIEVINEKIAELGMIVNVYPYYVFVCDLPNHVAVPNHRVMSAEEVTQLKNDYGIVETDCAPIPITDPPVIWCGGKAGDIIEIKRPSETSGYAYAYRRVDANLSWL